MHRTGERRGRLIAPVRTGPGTAVPRNEDRAAAHRRGPITCPICASGSCHAAFVRSTMASARIIGCAPTEPPWPRPGSSPWPPPPTSPCGPSGPTRAASCRRCSTGRRWPRARCASSGKPVAVVVAETASAAVDAAELVEVDYEAPAGGRRSRGGAGPDGASCSSPSTAATGPRGLAGVAMATPWTGPRSSSGAASSTNGCRPRRWRPTAPWPVPDR